MLKRRALTATLWSGADIFLRQGLQFAFTILLAHLLNPSEFGTIALLILFTGIATVFVDGGFSAALIQRQDVTHADESTVFWFNLSIGALVALALWGMAPVIAKFYSRPILVPLMAVLALNVFFGALGAIHSTLLTKQLDFRTQMKVGVIATILSGSIAVWMALRGYGVWALVVQAIFMTSVTTVLLWSFSRWRPAWIFSRISVQKLFSFGGYHLGSSLLDIIYIRFYTLLVGKFYGVNELGYYNNADTTKQLPSGFLTNVLSRVAFPMFAATADDLGKLRRGMQLAVRGTMLLNAPMMLGMAAIAEPLVRAVFGIQWLPAVPILRVLCIAGVLWPLHILNLNVLMAQGQSRLMFRLEAIKKIIGIGLLCGGTFFGVLGIAWSQVIFSVLALIINTYYTKRFLGYGIGGQLRDFWVVLFIATAMSLIVYLVSTVWDSGPVIELVALITIGALIFLASVWMLRLTAVQDMIALFKNAQTKNL